MYKKILVPLDGSEVADSVLPYVGNLAKRLDASVTLFTVVAPGRRAARESETAVRTEAEAQARRQAQHLTDAGVTADVLVVTGQPVEQIISRGQNGGFDLIAIGTRGHSGIRRGLLGSVTDGVVRSSTVPVLALSPKAVEASAQSGYGLTTVTVPLDGSDVAESVLSYAEDLAQQLALELRLLRVVSVGTMAYYAVEGGPVDTTPVEQELEEDAAQYLNGVAENVSRQELTVTCTVERGSPALAIIDHVKNSENNLVAICSHGRSGLGRLLIGSVADSIIRSSGVPVLVITPQITTSR
jgi:nucleotide-binding universal stress UspA family protein